MSAPVSVMEKIYSYKGFEVTVTLDAVRVLASDFTYGPPAGFVAVVRVCTPEPKRPIGLPIRLVTEGSRLFSTSDEALAAGLSAAQHAIDAKLPP